MAEPSPMFTDNPTLPHIKFGTDGWRGVIAEDFTFANVRRVAQAAAGYWRNEAAITSAVPRVVVGYDGRFLSEKFAQAAAEVLAANGIETIYASKISPTPAVSFAIKHRGLIGGLMITASHNPPEFNGIKIKDQFAGAADLDVTNQIESRLDREPPWQIDFAQAREQGKILIEDVCPAHIDALKNFVDLDRIERARLRVVIDSMHGAGGRELEKLLSSAGIEATTIRAERDPLFGGVNAEPIRRNLDALSNYLHGHQADIALVTDGDADRIGAMDSGGNFVSTHYCYAMLLLHMIRHRRETGCVVKALTTTSMVDRICKRYGLEMHETPVGFKWVARFMRQHDVLFGGEESGGMGFKGYIPERDGLLSGLMLLEFLACEGKPVNQIMSEMDAEFGASRYARVEKHCPVGLRQKLVSEIAAEPLKDLLGSPVVDVKHYDGVKMIAQDGSWLMLRGSGTEPVLRIYAEAQDQKRASALTELGECVVARLAEKI